MRCRVRRLGALLVPTPSAMRANCLRFLMLCYVHASLLQTQPSNHPLPHTPPPLCLYSAPPPFPPPSPFRPAHGPSGSTFVSHACTTASLPPLLLFGRAPPTGVPTRLLILGVGISCDGRACAGCVCVCGWCEVAPEGGGAPGDIMGWEK